MLRSGGDSAVGPPNSDGQTTDVASVRPHQPRAISSGNEPPVLLSVVEEAMRILCDQHLPNSELIASPWTGLHYRDEQV